jgi:hypothetical protein
MRRRVSKRVASPQIQGPGIFVLQMAIGQSVNPDASPNDLDILNDLYSNFLTLRCHSFSVPDRASFLAECKLQNFPYGMRQGGKSGQRHSVTIMSLSARRGPKILLPEIGSGVPDRRQAVLVVTTATLVISTLFVAARLLSRIAIVRRTAWDDYFIVLGWVRI